MLKLNTSNTNVSLNDMSKTDKTKYDVLLHIIQQAQPVSAYQVKNALRMNQPTARNICIRLEQEGVLAVYKKEKKGRKITWYGPHWRAFFVICALNRKMYSEMDTILDGWFTDQKFAEILKNDYGDIVTENPVYAKTLVKKIVLHTVRSLDEFDKMTDEEYDNFSRFAGEQRFIAKHPGELENIKEYIKHVKFYRENFFLTLVSNENMANFFIETLQNNIQFSKV